MASELPTGFTCCYRDIDGLKVELDLYLPPTDQEHTGRLLPSLVYFHGGGLTVGEKTSWFPFWIYDRAMTSGFAFISANYQLLPPATGHQLLEDIKHLFAFLENGINDVCIANGRNDHIDVGRIAVIGTSAGGLCAYLAGIHAKPKPKAILSMYGMGGNFFTRHYLSPKVTPFFRGRELLDPSTFSEFLFPKSVELSLLCSSPLSYYGSEHPIPGYPSNPRILLARLYLQLGQYMDYYTGEHIISISETLRSHLDKDMKLEDWSSLIPPMHQPIFPQLNASAFPPTFFIHGSQDTAVPVEDSHNLHRQLQLNGVVTNLKICPGMEHSFDYQPDAEQLWTAIFNEAFDFLKDQLQASEGIFAR